MEDTSLSVSLLWAVAPYRLHFSFWACLSLVGDWLGPWVKEPPGSLFPLSVH